MADLLIKNLRKTFGVGALVAVEDFNIHIRDGEFVTLLGPSGCGKSTTLAAVAGLDRPDQGLIKAGDKVFFSSEPRTFLEPERRNCGLVFQSYALWPHMTVFDNVAFALKLRKVVRTEQERRVMDSLALVEMEPYRDRYPHQLSGGQQQRVALARTLVYRPEVLLLDEPLSNLDAKLRDRARQWLGELRTKMALTTLYVTHDQIEALALSDRIVVMSKGKIEQIGTPQEIYENPASAFVADFIGTTNFLQGCRVVEEKSDRRFRIQLPTGAVITGTSPVKLSRDQEVVLALRPEHLGIGTAVADSREVLDAAVTGQSYIGGKWQVGLRVGKSNLRIETNNRWETEHLPILMPSDGAIAFPVREGAHLPN
ncbi:ABC transporter ATP-binding protein [Rhizobium sp. AU243]|uniref:ABC transporter ATP-binding protein n=1 Tax=Rhizobium sp. AU243 TaxID=2303425 RepID=UPI0010CB0EB0|nr:ABC transporter ATP-binding protein [Rhizobium sp. AU243]TKV70554.1 ABC transporter ATP-binding protein [Rhizobium sp. AU243]